MAKPKKSGKSKKAIRKPGGSELKDEELEKVSGGAGFRPGKALKDNVKPSKR